LRGPLGPLWKAGDVRGSLPLSIAGGTFRHIGEMPSDGGRLRTNPAQALGNPLVQRGLLQKPVEARPRNPVATGV
jgi:hypothetical protein